MKTRSSFVKSNQSKGRPTKSQGRVGTDFSKKPMSKAGKGRVGKKKSGRKSKNRSSKKHKIKIKE